MPARRKPGIPHSDHPGVTWNVKLGKWFGITRDRSVRVGKVAKVIYVGVFADEQACADAVAAKKAEIEAAIAQKLHSMAQEIEHTRGLPLRSIKAKTNQMPTHPKSDHPGVTWKAKEGKWRGYVYDRSVRNGTKPKEIHVGFFVDEQACAEATAAKRAEVEAAISKKLHAMAQQLEHTRGLPLRPTNAVDAEPETAYYGEKKRYSGKGGPKEFGPQRLVRSANKSKSSGFELVACCRAFLDSGAPCTTLASHDRKHCNAHGGGFKVGEARGAQWCTHCKTTSLAPKRQPQHGGNGVCPTCENRLKAEAEANGSEAPIEASKRWEDVVFEQLLPLIKYLDGTPFPPDQRDERKGGGLGTSSTKKRGRECDTTTNRFPDCLWVLRDENGRAVLVVIVEVDEHSHTDRDPMCESGKLDDTFQALQDKLAKEGAARGAVARHDAQMVPIVTVRVNPNAYDKKVVKLPERVKAVAAVVRAYLHMDDETREALQTHAPIVHVLYYHTEQGARNLAHYAAKAVEAGWQCTVHAP